MYVAVQSQSACTNHVPCRRLTYSYRRTNVPSPPRSRSILKTKNPPSLVATITLGVWLPIATTLFTGCPLLALGIRTQAKSRWGSHISVTEDGKYPAARDTSDVLTFCDVLRTMDMKFGRPLVGFGSADGFSLAERSVCDSEVEGDTLRSREDHEGFETWFGEAGGEP